MKLNFMNEINDSKYNILKLVAMFFIIMWHYIVHSNLLGSFAQAGVNNFFTALTLFIMMHINLFVMITGFYQYGKKARYNKITQLYLYVVFYLVLGLIISYVITGEGFTIGILLKQLLPSSIGQYWFIVSYIILYLLSDYINIIIDKLNKKEYQILIATLFILFSVIPFLTGGSVIANNGYNFYHFVGLYFLGAYLKKYPLQENKIFKKMSNKKYAIILILLLLFTCIINYFWVIICNSHLMNDNIIISTIAYRTNGSIFSYARPFIIIQSIFFFELFGLIKIKSRIINFLVGSTIGVYLLTDNPFIRSSMYAYLGCLNSRDVSFIYKFVIISILILIVSLLVDLVRRLLFYSIKRLYRRILIIINKKHR